MQTMNTQQAAEFLGLSVNQTLELARRGEFPAKSWGNKWTFIQEFLEEWLINQARAEQEARINALLDNPKPEPKRGTGVRKRKELVEV